MQALKAEKSDLIEQNGRLGLEFRELQSRNRRQEDFIFDVQGKMDALDKKNQTLVEEIEQMVKSREEERLKALEETKNEDAPDFREFGAQTEPVRVLSIVRHVDACCQYEQNIGAGDEDTDTTLTLE